MKILRSLQRRHDILNEIKRQSLFTTNYTNAAKDRIKITQQTSYFTVNLRSIAKSGQR